jgi:hypothetical protein
VLHLKCVDSFFPEEQHRVAYNIHDIDSTSDKSFIYHYTGIDSVLGILSSKQIWLMDYSGLNDTKEGFLLFDALSNRLSEQDQKVLYDVYEKINKNTFVSSFSAFGNMLGLWRGYGSVNIGLSYPEIKYSHNFIEDLKGESLLTSGIQVESCTYVNDSTIEKTAIWLYSKFKWFMENSKKNYQLFALTLGNALYTAKHLGFFEENEVRILYSFWNCNPFVSEKKKRFLKFRFTPNSVKRLVVGPSGDSTENYKKLKDFVQSHEEYNHVDIFKSTIPFVDTY